MKNVVSSRCEPPYDILVGLKNLPFLIPENLRRHVLIVNKAIEELRQRSLLADEMIAALRRQIADVRRVAVEKLFREETAALRRENQALESEMVTLKARLVAAEIRNGVKQIPIFTTQALNSVNIIPQVKVEDKSEPKAEVKTEPAAPAKKVEGGKQAKKAVVNKETADQKASNKEVESEPDVSLLDFRVGFIKSAKKHPDADSLYVEEVELGEERPRTVVSGLVKFVPIEEMQNRLAVLLCNLKPAKMRGVLSEAMVMCASTPDKVEILEPPEGSVAGDRVTCQGHPGQPEKQLNPKKKTWEQIAPHLKTDENRVATYKGAPFVVEGKGLVLAPTLTCVQIK